MITIGIIAMLTAVGLGAAQTMSDRARKVRETSAARTLITAYLSTTTDHNGEYLLGYDQSTNELPQPDGTVISGEAAHRYPFRLAPYFSYQMHDTVLVNYNTSQLDKNMLTYMTSLNPALGMNSLLVGGNTTDASGTVSYPNDCLRRPSMTSKALLVFASAAYDGGGKRINGYFKLTPPNLGSSMWSPSKWSAKSSASDYGNVDGRYGGQAVCAFTDGSVRSMGIDDLRDMRLWSVRAAEKENGNYTLPSNGSGGGGRL